MHRRCRKHWLPWAASGNGWRRWRRLLQIQRAGSQYKFSSGRYTLGRSPRCSATNLMAVLQKQQQIDRLWCQGSIAVLPPEAHEHPVALAARQRLLGGLTAPSTARRGPKRLLQQSQLPQIWRRLSARGVLLFDVETTCDPQQVALTLQSQRHGPEPHVPLHIWQAGVVCGQIRRRAQWT